MTGWRVSLPVAGRRVLVVGGGPSALPRIAGALDAGAHVVVSAEVLGDTVLDLVDRGLVEHLPRSPTEVDLESADLVVAVTGEPAADADLATRAAAAHRLCLVPDRPNDPRRRPERAG